ncbi:MAG: hypothetical protein KY434_09505 [Actinobacteria bacterium]|nr:hypothetical protein [Actinomycetota bacterium]
MLDTRRPVIATLVLAFALVMGAAACSGAADDTRQTFIDAMTSDGGIDEEAAGCVFDELEAQLGDEDLEALMADFEREPEDPAVAQAVVAAVQTCLGS